MERRYRTKLSDCHPAIETALRETLGDDEQFILALQTTDRFIRRDTRLVITCDRLVVVYSGFLDIRIQDIPLVDVESIETDRSGSGLPTLAIHTARSTDRFDIKTSPTEFVDTLYDTQQSL